MGELCSDMTRKIEDLFFNIFFLFSNLNKGLQTKQPYLEKLDGI